MAIHGGGYSIGSKDMIPSSQIEYLVRNGFVVVSVNFRLCPQVSVAEGPIGDTKKAYHWCRDMLPTLIMKDTGIECDGDRIVVFGSSSGGHLALLIGLESPPPKAILDFYGTLYLSDEWFTKPVALPVPDLSEDFINKVFEEPTLTYSAQRAATRARDDESGMDCRTAWLMNKMKNGTLVSTIFKSELDKYDPAVHFAETFPPTFFAYGKDDKLVNVELGKRGYERLRALGVATGIEVVEGGGHGYDSELKEGDEKWKDGVQKGLDFLIEHA